MTSIPITTESNISRILEKGTEKTSPINKKEMKIIVKAFQKAEEILDEIPNRKFLITITEIE